MGGGDRRNGVLLPRPRWQCHGTLKSPLTLPVLAAQSPVGLEHNVEEGRGMGVGMLL